MNKRAVFLRSKFDDHEDTDENNNNKVIKTEPVSTVFDIFKGGKNVEMGVSFVDMFHKK